MAPLTCCLNQLWWGGYLPLEEDTWISDQPSIPLCRMAKHFKLCSHHGPLYHQADIPDRTFPNALGSHFLGTGSHSQTQTVEKIPSVQIPVELTVCPNPFSHCCPSPPTEVVHGIWMSDTCGAGLLLNWDHCVSVGDSVCLGEDPAKQFLESWDTGQRSLYSQIIQGWDRASESHRFPWHFVSTSCDCLRNKKKRSSSKCLMSVFLEGISWLSTNNTLSFHCFPEEETSSSKESDFSSGGTTALGFSQAWCKYLACCPVLLCVLSHPEGRVCVGILWVFPIYFLKGSVW